MLSPPSLGAVHYMLCHRVIRDHFFLNPKRFFERLTSDDGPVLLQRLWEEACDQSIETTTPGLYIPALTITPVSIQNRLGMLIEMPPPIRAPDAYFVLAISSPVQQRCAARFFTLEKSDNLPGSTATALCEWIQGNQHGLIQFINSAEPRSFIEAVRHLLGLEADKR